MAGVRRSDGAGTGFGVCLVLVATCGVVLAAWARHGFSLSVDEPFTALAAQRSLVSLKEEIWPHDNTPVSYVVLKAWSAIGGTSEMSLRAPFLLAYGVAVIFAGLAARAAGGTAAGLMAAVAVASSGRLGLLHAATARPYALLCTLSAAVAWLYAACERASDWRPLARVGHDSRHRPADSSDVYLRARERDRRRGHVRASSACACRDRLGRRDRARGVSGGVGGCRGPDS